MYFGKKSALLKSQNSVAITYVQQNSTEGTDRAGHTSGQADVQNLVLPPLQFRNWKKIEDAAEFRTMFRMDLTAFEELLQMVNPLIEKPGMQRVQALTDILRSGLGSIFKFSKF